MRKPLPFIPKNFINDMSKTDLNDFFGFCLAKIECPKNIKIPLLPYKTELGEILFPTGSWTEVYFSEELKAVIPHGYKVTLIKGISFSKSILFDKYIEHFYKIKKYAKTVSERFIAKMHLNQLYGYFGRSRSLNITKIVDKKTLNNLLLTRVINSIIKIKDDLFIVLYSANLNFNLIKHLNKFNINNNINIKYDNTNKKIKSNVSISAAVTAYARIEMIKYKTLEGYIIFYTDTDSNFSNKPLPENFVGEEIGQMKDELKGKVIYRGLFLGNKKYCYQYFDDDNILQTISIFAGIPKKKENILTWDDFVKMSRGETIKVKLSNTFERNFSSLDIQIKETTVNINKSNNKKLLNNKYIPLHIKILNHKFNFNFKFNSILNKIIQMGLVEF
jgi:DNA polymerase type B, organellar and viral